MSPPPSLLRPSGSDPTDEKPHFKQQRTFERPFELQEHRRRPRERVLQSAFRLGPWGSGPRRQSTYVTGTTEGRRQAGYQGPGPADREERARSVTCWKAARMAAERAWPLPSQRMGETRPCREGCSVTHRLPRVPRFSWEADLSRQTLKREPEGNLQSDLFRASAHFSQHLSWQEPRSPALTRAPRGGYRSGASGCPWCGPR